MRYRLTLLGLGFVIILSNSACKKEAVSTSGCYPGAETIRQIEDKQATIQQVDNVYYILEQGTIDTRLLPCNLPQEFKEDGLSVVVSGAVKARIRNGVEPCCTDNFVIDEIKN